MGSEGSLEMAGRICGSCVTAYCSCQEPQLESGLGESGQDGCLVHSCCCFCNRSLEWCSKNERSVKRKFARVDEDEVESETASYSKRQRDGVGDDDAVVALRRALRAEREVVNRLYMELEEERNAAAIAAAETLSMISRLQEEKAAVQMEARQYERMVEERRLYDQEAIEMLNDILVRQEEEKLALEKEIEKYRGMASRELPGTSDQRPERSGASKSAKRSWDSPEDDDFVTPFESNSGIQRTRAGSALHKTRNLLDSFQSVDHGLGGQWVGPDYGRRNGATGVSNSRGSSMGASADRSREMDIDEPRDESGSSRIHDVYEIPRQFYTAASGGGSGTEEDGYSERRAGWRKSDYDTASDYQGPRTETGYSRSSQRGYDRLGKPDPMPGSCVPYSGVQGSRSSQDGALISELRRLNERLQSLEAERDFKHVGSYGSRNSMNEMEILEEISQQLRHFQALDRKQDDVKELLPPEASFVFSFKGIFSFNGLRQSLHSHVNRLACMFLKHSDNGLGYGDHHHVGLSHLLESSRKARGALPCITRGIKVDAPSYMSSNLRHSNAAWPMDARGRSETALGGWDY